MEGDNALRRLKDRLDLRRRARTLVEEIRALGFKLTPNGVDVIISRIHPRPGLSHLDDRYVDLLKETLPEVLEIVRQEHTATIVKGHTC